MKLKQAALAAAWLLLSTTPSVAQEVVITVTFRDVQRVSTIGTKADASGTQGRWLILKGDAQLVHSPDWTPEPGASLPIAVENLNIAVASADIESLTALRDVYSECSRYSLLAQNQPGKYDLIVNLKMSAPPTWNASSRSVAAWLAGHGGHVWCELIRE